VKTSFVYGKMFDQCGLLVYLDSDNWMKAGLEYENETFSRLGSVVTNSGYSDWATCDIENRNSMYYRLNRRGPDFLIESSFDGIEFTQMRIFHMHLLGETTAAMGKEKQMSGKAASVRVGLYASSPMDSSFTARFSEIELTECRWTSH
jgi:regulation of enolase protein 1 (concanavalin A-like superfamily)